MSDQRIEYTTVSTSYSILEAELHGLTRGELQKRSFYDVMNRLTREMPRADLVFPLTFQVTIEEKEDGIVYRMHLRMIEKKG